MADAVDGRSTARTGSEMQLAEFEGEVERSMVEGCGMGWVVVFVRGRRVVFVNFSKCAWREEERVPDHSCGCLG